MQFETPKYWNIPAMLHDVADSSASTSTSTVYSSRKVVNSATIFDGSGPRGVAVVWFRPLQPLELMLYLEDGQEQQFPQVEKDFFLCMWHVEVFIASKILEELEVIHVNFIQNNTGIINPPTYWKYLGAAYLLNGWFDIIFHACGTSLNVKEGSYEHVWTHRRLPILFRDADQCLLCMQYCTVTHSWQDTSMSLRLFKRNSTLEKEHWEKFSGIK